MRVRIVDRAKVLRPVDFLRQLDVICIQFVHIYELGAVVVHFQFKFFVTLLRGIRGVVEATLFVITFNHSVLAALVTLLYQV